MIHYPTRKDLIASFAKDTVGVEVGVQAGVFSQEILDCGVKHLHLVDPWIQQSGIYELDPANVDDETQTDLYFKVKSKFLKNPKVTIHRTKSLELASNFCDLPDWVYLDGRHDYYSVLQDLWAWSSELRTYPKSGFICGHDYVDNHESISMGFGVKKAVDRFCELSCWEMTAITDEEWPSYMLERK